MGLSIGIVGLPNLIGLAGGKLLRFTHQFLQLLSLLPPHYHFVDFLSTSRLSSQNYLAVNYDKGIFYQAPIKSDGCEW